MKASKPKKAAKSNDSLAIAASFDDVISLSVSGVQKATKLPSKPQVKTATKKKASK